GVGVASLSEIAAAEVARQHARGWHKAGSVDRIRSRFRSLKAGEEKQLVALEWSADRAAVLVALQRVASRCIRVAGIQHAVAEELEQIPMELVRAGLHDSRYG